MLQAQVDTLLLLPDVAVIRQKILNEEGRDWESVDSSSLNLSRAGNLGELLSNSQGIFIKNYGPAGISSSSIRGGSAAHTAILWNGVNIQNPMLGQTDFSLFPVILSDNVLISKGGPASAEIQGAVGGAIQLKNNFDANQPVLVFQSSIGSFKNYQNSLRLQLGKDKIISVTRLFHQSALNNFPYQNLQQKTLRLDHAKRSQWGIMQEARLKTDANSILDVHLWYQDAQRQNPPNKLQINSVAEQEDRSFRGVAKWKKWTDRHAFLIQASFVNDQLDYRDSLALINSISTSNLLTLKAEDKLYTAYGDFRFALDYSRTSVNTNNYDFIPERNQILGSITFKKESRNNKWSGQIGLTNGMVNGEIQPILPSLDFNWRLHENAKINAGFSRNYRLPSFNDLYWVPGGNINLKPEKSWSFETGVELGKKSISQKTAVTFKSSVFSRIVDNWIIWLPSGLTWQPENAKKVWSRGLESKLTIIKRFKKLDFKFQGWYDYILSTNTAATGTATSSIGKQLIYQPVHVGGGSMEIQYSGFQFQYNQRWNGAVFTTRDNSKQLSAYSLGTIALKKNFRKQGMKFSLMFQVDNIWNKSYEVVAFFPMPGRSYQLQLIYSINNIQSTIINQQ